MTTPLDRSVPGVARVALASMFVLAFGTFYWGFIEAQSLGARPDNPRRIAFDRRIRRGAILDRWGAVLAQTAFEDGLPTRSYPVPPAAPVTGYQTWRYGAGAGGASYGAGGAEAAYDAALRGDLGLSPRELLATRLLHRPQTGRSVRLTLDAALQGAAAELMGPREGAVVVLDIETGAVRALVSLPTFDPAALDAGTYSADDPEGRMFNRATQGRYPPGSIWKTVTLAGALQAGLVSLDTVVDDGDAVEIFDGYAVGCDNNPEGVTRFDIARAYAWSCNVTFARLATGLGAEEFRRVSQDFGLGQAPPFALPVAPGMISADPSMTPPELAAAGFGQGELLVTPLHMALVAAAMARDGSLPVPRLLAEVEGLPGAASREPRGEWLRAVDGSTAKKVREAMVISGREGWARSATAGLGFEAAGKTGTAEVATGPPHAWYIGFAPADDPQLAVAVLVVHGGQGAAVAAPIAGRVLRAGLAREARSGRGAVAAMAAKRGSW